MLLEQLTKALGVLKVRSFTIYCGDSTNLTYGMKQMVENKEAWKELLLTLGDHRDQFNEQLVLMKQDNTTPNADSPVLAPLKGYSRSERSLTYSESSNTSIKEHWRS
jgi:hypothetical protein